MNATDELAANCVIKDSRKRNARPSGQADDPTACEVVESMRRLMALGLTAGEIEELGLKQSTLLAICEYARLDAEDASVDATLRILEQEMRNAELEQEMLGLRKRALTKRAKLLRKLARLLDRREASPLESEGRRRT